MFCHWKIHLTGEDGKLILRKKVTVRQGYGIMGKSNEGADSYSCI